MSSTKPWYLSRTIWAAIVSVAATLAHMAGFQFDPALKDGLVDTILQLAAAGGGLIAIFGRLSATRRID